MARRLKAYRLDEFRGENNRDGLTNQRIFGRQGRMMSLMRNYHLIGYGRALRRRGYQEYATNLIDGANPLTGLHMYNFGSTQRLLGVSNGKVARLAGAGTTWSDISGDAAISTDKNDIVRWTDFQTGGQSYSIGCDGQNYLFIVGATGDASKITANSAPTSPIDVCEFNGYLFTLNANGVLEYTDYGTLDWSSSNSIQCSLNSDGVGLSLHSRNAMLVFYDRQVYRIELNTSTTGSAAFFSYPVADEGCISRSSIISKDGYTYWASERGFWRLGRLDRQAEFIGYPVGNYWQELSQNRRPYITAVDRPHPWTEVCWLVSHGSNDHNAVMVWNTFIGGWTIFPVSSVAGKLEFNVGTTYKDTNGLDRTVVGADNGVLYEAWGTKDVDSGNTDDGTTIRTDFQTGFLDFEYPGVSEMREMWLDLELNDQKTFDLTVESLGARPTLQKSFVVGTSAHELDVGFMLDSSFLEVQGISNGLVKAEIASRNLQIKISEESEGPPYAITALNIPHLNTRMQSH